MMLRRYDDSSAICCALWSRSIFGIVVRPAGAWGLLGWPVVVSPTAVLIAVGTSAAVGTFFGLWPAWKASRLDPMEALRHE